MTGTSPHSAAVDAWLARASAGASPDELCARFDQAFQTLWRRAHRTLGEVTLAAILDRVLYNAAQRHPALSVLSATEDGIPTGALRQARDSLSDQALRDGVRFVLGEFLTVLGNLTADILSPALHTALSRLGTQAAPFPGPETAGEPGHLHRSDGEGTPDE